MKSIVAAAGLVAVAQAFTQPVQPPTYGSLLTPDINTPVTTGQEYTITWSPKQPADGVTVSLVLCNGPSTNCVLQNTAIVEGVAAAAGSYKWNVPCSLPSGVQATATGYGMLIIVDGTGEFQYSTQFSVNAGASCGSSSSSTTSATSSSKTSSATTTPSGTTSSSKPSSTTSASTTPSSSGSATSSVNTDGWAPWNTVGSSTLSTTTVPAPTTPVPVTTSKPAATTPAYTTSASSTFTNPQQFTGAAAVPTAFANAAGLIGAAALAVFAL